MFRARFAYGMTAPALVVVLGILGFPVLLNVLVGFTNASALTGIGGLKFVGLETYQTVFGDSRFQTAFGLTIVWTFVGLPVQLAIGLALALQLHAARGRLPSLMRALWVLPWVLPAASAFYVWRLLFHPEAGTLGSLLAALGAERPILADPGLALWGVLAAAAWKGYPFYMLMFYSGLASVPQDLYDAARVDGAGRWRVFRDIELPEIAPIVAIAALLGFVGTFNWLTPILVMTDGGPGGATTTLGLYIYNEGLRAFHLANAAVASTALLLVVLVIFIILFFWRRYAGRSETTSRWAG